MTMIVSCKQVKSWIKYKCKDRKTINRYWRHQGIYKLATSAFVYIHKIILFCSKFIMVDNIFSFEKQKHYMKPQLYYFNKVNIHSLQKIGKFMFLLWCQGGSFGTISIPCLRGPQKTAKREQKKPKQVRVANL